MKSFGIFDTHANSNSIAPVYLQISQHIEIQCNIEITQFL